MRTAWDFIEFSFGDRVDRLSLADIKTLTLKDGKFSIHTHESRWFSKSGKFHFDYSAIGNASLFLRTLDWIGGVPFDKERDASSRN
jgi:hypothetical protein